jgi:hypothetical protein
VPIELRRQDRPLDGRAENPIEEMVLDPFSASLS